MYHCTECDSTDIQVVAWMKQESDGTLVYQEMTLDDGCYCNECQAHTKFIYKDEGEV